MKNNTEKAKALLQKALVETPDDFALTEVRSHIRAALNKLEKVEDQRLQREQARTKRIEKLEQQAIRPVDGKLYNPWKVIELIDEMIAGEKAKIEEIQRRRSGSQKKDDDDELQTLLN